jgi:hypothetical protein
MTTDEYSSGKQPCGSYLPQAGGIFSFAQYPLCGKSGCTARTALCECCLLFHHSGGLDACPTNKTTLQPEPRSGLETSWED